MKRKGFYIGMAVLCMLSPAAHAQDVPAPGAIDPVFSPTVSSLRAEVKGGMIQLSWEDSPDVRGSVFIFRTLGLTDPKVAAGMAPLAQVPYGAESYIDHYDGDGVINYFVFSSDDSGRKFDVVIPFGNTLKVELSSKESLPPAAMPAAMPTTTPAANKPVIPVSTVASRIDTLNAAVREDSVVLSFTPETPDAPILLYRSAQPIRGVTDLLNAVIVQAGSVSSPFVDYPIPGISYYYALVHEEDLRVGVLSIEPGRNATIVPVEIPIGRYRIGLPKPRADLRSMPLPLLSVHSAVQTAAGIEVLPAPVPLSAEAAMAIAALPPPLRRRDRAEKRPRVFAEDLEDPVGVEEFTLRFIVQGAFSQRDWRVSADHLEKFLSLPRSVKGEGRARFYLGQSYYFSGRIQDALFQFLLLRTKYPGEASEWIQALLPHLGSQGMPE